MTTPLRCRDAVGLHARLQHLQPRSAPLLGAALADGLDRFGCKAFLAVDPDGRTAGAVVLRRWGPRAWLGYGLVLDASAAPVLGEVIDRSPARSLLGFAGDLASLRPHVSRWRDSTSVPAAGVAPGFDWPDPPAWARPAQPRDHAQMTELAWRYGPHSLRRRGLLSRRIRRAIAEGAVVVEAGDPATVVGYGVLESQTPEYDLWAHMVVDPRFRGRGLGWDLVAAMAAQTRARGAGAVVTLLASNPMTVPEGRALTEEFVYAELAPRSRRGGR